MQSDLRCLAAKVTMIQMKTPLVFPEKPVDRRIFGCFIESGFGRQCAGMWSEMLYNRAFRKVEPYYIATWEWLGIEEKLYNENAPFWHSGYEEHDWQPVGAPAISHTLGSRTYKGTTSMRLCGKVGEGLSQQGLYMQAGRSYDFSLFAGLDGWLEGAGLNGYGDSTYEEVYRSVTVTIGENTHVFNLTTASAQYDWSFTATRTATETITITLGFDGGVFLSWASLMPADNLGGWRREVVEKLREAGPSVVRFPGGCFASFFDWRGTVGDRGTREPLTSFYWGGLEENDVGVDEFMHLTALCDFEPQFCFNMMTSDPFRARELVEYLNADGSTGCGRLRMLNGHREPYGVRLFEMDNEPARKWSAEAYARQCVAFAREMRLADPTIEFMCAAYSYPLEALPGILEIAGKDIDYVIYRQGNPDFVSRALAIIRAYNAENGRALRLVNTEWIPPFDSIEPFEDPGVPTDFHWSGKITNDFRTVISTQQRSWNCALNGAHRLMDYMSYGGEFALANFNNMCNTWGQNIIEAPKDSCFLSNMGEVFRFFKRWFAPCRAAVAPTDDRRLFAVMARDEARELLFVVNHASAAVEVALPEGEWQALDGLQGKGRLTPMKSEGSATRACLAEVSEGKAGFAPLSIHVLARR